ncbi:hypothetical protein [Actinokineospora fastidiosa]|uniref:hypothetical protein n=1 Tax=Actinokineospora fastidiosa TaxID=1816 RepID=UPI001670C0D8|nr:hypothetical protein [Actinokineospora fastidiosa]
MVEQARPEYTGDGPVQQSGPGGIAPIERSGFAIEHLDRFRFPDARTPTSFYILGTAVARH